MGAMKSMIIGISLSTAVAFLIISVISTIQIFTLVIGGTTPVRGELWLLVITTFTGGIIMLSIAWGIAELTETRRHALLNTSASQNNPDDEA